MSTLLASTPQCCTFVFHWTHCTIQADACARLYPLHIVLHYSMSTAVQSTANDWFTLLGVKSCLSQWELKYTLSHKLRRSYSSLHTFAVNYIVECFKFNSESWCQYLQQCSVHCRVELGCFLSLTNTSCCKCLKFKILKAHISALRSAVHCRGEPWCFLSLTNTSQYTLPHNLRCAVVTLHSTVQYFKLNYECVDCSKA